MQRVPITVTGHEKLHAELERLKKQERPRVIQAIAEARAHGDLRENAEYHAAKESQGFIEGRIHELEAKLSHCHIIDVTIIPNEGKVIFGSTVTLMNFDNELEVCYRIVGEDEADLKNNTISINSPIARAMIGKNEGDEFEVQTPQGIVGYQIVKVEYL
jgi:transcription elongation factor GreA